MPIKSNARPTCASEFAPQSFIRGGSHESLIARDELNGRVPAENRLLRKIDKIARPTEVARFAEIRPRTAFKQYTAISNDYAWNTPRDTDRPPVGVVQENAGTHEIKLGDLRQIKTVERISG